MKKYFLPKPDPEAFPETFSNISKKFPEILLGHYPNLRNFKFHLKSLILEKVSGNSLESFPKVCLYGLRLLPNRLLVEDSKVLMTWVFIWPKTCVKQLLNLIRNWAESLNWEFFDMYSIQLSNFANKAKNCSFAGWIIFNESYSMNHTNWADFTRPELTSRLGFLSLDLIESNSWK